MKWPLRRPCRLSKICNLNEESISQDELCKVLSLSLFFSLSLILCSSHQHYMYWTVSGQYLFSLTVSWRKQCHNNYGVKLRCHQNHPPLPSLFSTVCPPCLLYCISPPYLGRGIPYFFLKFSTSNDSIPSTIILWKIFFQFSAKVITHICYKRE